MRTAPADRPSLRWSGFRRLRSDELQYRRIVAAGRRHKAVGEPQQDMLRGRLIEIDRNAPPLMQHHRTQIVDAMGLIGMLVGEKHRVDVIDIGVDQLLAQIRRGIDHDPRGAAFRRPLDQQGAAAAAVFRIARIAGAPAQRRPRHAGRRSAAENGQRQRHAAAFAGGTLLNRRKKFSVVWRDISSSETPRVSASTFAISTT